VFQWHLLGELGGLSWISATYGRVVLDRIELRGVAIPGPIASVVPEDGMFCRYARQFLPAAVSCPATEAVETRQRWVDTFAGGDGGGVVMAIEGESSSLMPTCFGQVLVPVATTSYREAPVIIAP